MPEPISSKIIHQQTNGSESMVTLTALPRELIRWLGTLNLTFPVKNPRRSLCNGYLIAEILNRYLPKDVPLHGLDTGTGGRTKTRNWMFLRKVFAKLDIQVPEESIVDTIKEKPGAVNTIMSIIYQAVHGHTYYIQNPNPSQSICKSTHQETYINPPPEFKSSTKECTDRVITTSAASELLGLASMPTNKIFVWHLFNEVTGISDWTRVDTYPEQFDERVVMNKVQHKSIEFGIAFKTDSKPNILHLITFLWSAFRLDVSSLAFNLAAQLLESFSHHLVASQAHHVCDTLVNGLDPLLPLIQLPMFDQKLGIMARICSTCIARPAQHHQSMFPTSGINLPILIYFKTHLPLHILAYFLAGLETYPGDQEFWNNEVDLIIRQAEQDSDLELSKSAVCFVGSVGRYMGNLTPSMLGFLRATIVDMGKDFAPIVVLALLDILHGQNNNNNTNNGVQENDWIVHAIIQFSYHQIQSPTVSLSMAYKSIGLVTKYPILSGAMVRFLMQVPNPLLRLAFKTPQSVQPIKFLKYIEIGPLANCFQLSTVCEGLAMGIATNTSQVPPHLLEPLFPYVLSSGPEVLLTILRTIGTELLLIPSTESWTYLRDICKGVPIPLLLDTNESEKVISTLAFAIISVLVYHKVNGGNHGWMNTARDDIMDVSRNANTRSRTSPIPQCLWDSVSSCVMEQWNVVTELQF